MNPFIFHAPTRVMFGESIAQSAPEMAKEFGGCKVILVTDDVLLKSGILKPIIDAFQSDDLVQLTIFSDVPPDSDVTCVQAATAMARDHGCDTVVSIGGGSVIDTGKALAICLTFGGDILDFQGMNNLPSKLMPHICIPTTAGTGSEVSMVAMVKHAAEGKKIVFGSRFIAPDIAFLDPTLLVSLPPRLTAATGLDAVTHAIEAYTSLQTVSPASDLCCLESLRMMFKYLPIATRDGADLEARSNTLVASTMAGIAFTNTGVGVVHALAHATGGQFGTHHGMTNAVFLTHCMNFNLDVAGERYANIARHLHLSDSKNDDIAAAALIAGVEELSVTVGLPRRLRDMGIPELVGEELRELGILAETDPAIMFNAKEATLDDIVGIYERAY